MKTLNKKENKELNETIKQYISQNPDVDNNAVARLFKISVSTVIALKAHITIKNNKIDNKKYKLAKTNTFSNLDGEVKDEVRSEFVKAIWAAILANGINKPILTLAGEDFKFEKLLLKKGKEVQFVCVEQDRETYKTMCSKNAIEDLCFDLIHSTEQQGGIGTIIKEAKENQFSHLNLDYCGQINKVANDVLLFMQRNIIPVKGICCLTVNNRGDITRGICKEMLELNPKTLAEDKVIEHCIRTLILTAGNGRYAIKQSIPYYDIDTQKGTKKANMIAFIIERIK